MTNTIDSQIKVLVCFEKPEDEYFATRLNESLGCQVEFARTLDDSLLKLDSFSPDLIIIDFDFKESHDLKLLKQIRSNTRWDNALIIALVSENVKDYERLLIISNGADDLIVKPINLAEFALKLEHMIEKQKYRIMLERQISILDHDKALLSMYFSQDVKDFILAESVSSKEGGIHTIATIMFFDIRQSTKIAEELPPDLFAQFISEIFREITALIYANHGSVNKYLGDGILATFGVPVYYNNDVFNALKCALAIRRFFGEYNKKRPIYIKDDVAFGVGVTSGKIFAGNVGSSFRMEYTVLGDPVNLASRLQSLAGMAHVDILLDGNTYDNLKDLINVRNVKFSKIRGKMQDVRVYYLTSLKDEEAIATSITKQELEMTYDNKAGEVDFF